MHLLSASALLALGLEGATGCSVDDGGAASCLVGSTDTCDGDDVCIGATCRTAFPHAYAITQLSITAPSTRPDGRPWSSAPDGSPSLYAEVSVAGANVATTPVLPTTFNATFPGPYAITLGASVDLDVRASSNDGSGPAEVYDCDVPMITALVLRTHYVLCSGTGVTLNYTIQPT